MIKRRVALILLSCMFLANSLFLVSFSVTAAENDSSVPLRVEATADHIVNYITWYGNTEKNDFPSKMFPELTDNFKNDTITALYESVPEELRDNIVLIVVGSGMANKASYDKMLEFYHRTAAECQTLNLKFILQCVNGHTRSDWLIDLDVFEEFAKTYSCFAGINAAELYNGPEWRTDLWGDHSDYIAEAIRRMAKYGCQVMWHDANIFGEDGLFLDWIQNNENLYNAMKEHYKNITILYKQSFSYPLTESVIYGLWLNKMIGSFGIASDWWYRQINSVDGKYVNVLWDEYKDDDPMKGVLNDTWEMIFNYPEAQYGQDMMKMIANGATCFSQEAQFYSISTYGTRLTPAEKVVWPLMREVETGRLKVPTYEQMLAKTQAAFVGKDAYLEIVHGNRVIGHETSGESLPTDGQYGLIPTLPKTLRMEDKQFFADNGIQLVYNKQLEEYYDALYEDKTYEGTTAYANNVGDTWYFMNNTENKKNATQVAYLAPQLNNSDKMTLKLNGQAFGYLTESEDQLNFVISNYVSSRKELNYRTDINVTESGYWGFLNILINYWFGVRDQPDGRYGGAADDSLDAAGRWTMVELDGQLKKPVVTFEDYSGTDSYRTPLYEYEESYDPVTKKYVLKILHNGQVNFSVQTFGDNLNGKSVTVNGESKTELNDGNSETSLSLKRGDEIVVDMREASDELQRYEINKVSLGVPTAFSLFVGTDGENYSLISNIDSKKPIGSFVKIILNRDTVVSELQITAKKFLGNTQFAYPALLTKLTEAKSKPAANYTEGTYSVLSDAIEFAEKCIRENEYSNFYYAEDGLSRAIDELVRTYNGRETESFLLSQSDVDLYLYGVDEQTVEVLNFNENAKDKEVTYEFVAGDSSVVELVRINPFEYVLKAKEKGTAKIRFFVDGTDAEAILDVSVNYYPITNVAYRKKSVTVGNGLTWTDLLTDGKIDERYTMPVIINSIEEAVPENVRGNYYVIDLEKAYTLKYIKVHPYLVHKSIKGLVVLASNDLNFSSGNFRTIYNGDTQNVHGFGAGADPEFYAGARADVEESDEKYRYILVTGLGNGWHCQGSDPVWPFGHVQLVEVEVFAEIVNEEAIGGFNENKAKLQSLVNQQKARNIKREDYESYTFKKFNSAILRAEIVLDEIDNGAYYNSYDLYSCYDELLNWSTKLINVKEARAVEKLIQSLDESRFDAYAYENFENEVYGYIRSLRVPTRIYDDDFNLLVDDVTMDYRPLLNEGFSDSYVLSKQAEVDGVTQRMYAALDQLYVESIDGFLMMLGKPSIEKKDRIEEILAMYDSLSAEQQAKIQLKSRLDEARKVIDQYNTGQMWKKIGMIGGSVVLVAAIALTVVLVILKKRKEGKVE